MSAFKLIPRQPMRQPPVRRLTKFLTALSILAVANAPLMASAYTSMAVSDTHKSIAFVGNSAWAEQADIDALALCDVEMRKVGIAPACRIFARTDVLGWYAVVCGELGCGASMGQRTLKEAQEKAYESCYEIQKFCFTSLTASGKVEITPQKKGHGAK